uniref:Malectin domain-containing protein n=1 Tax=mine drainage metagenome TaxID=410659 RepID=E6QIR4_9ZZZZ
MARLLKYLCSNHFSENKSGLNEYKIAVEALGRPADFDPAKNSSVRVEMHRLRARLRKYYETEGANNPLRIALEDGHYGLRFVRRGDGLPASSSESQGVRNPGEERGDALAGGNDSPGKPLVEGNAVDEPAGRRIPHTSAKGVAIAATIVVVASISVWMLIGAPWRGRLAQPPVAPPPPSVAGASTAGAAENRSVLILAGYPKEKYIDSEGRVWEGDRYFTGGKAVELNVPFIQGTTDITMFRTARTGEFSYNIPVKPGIYELRLHFVETTFGPGTPAGRGESNRIFSVFLGERPLLVDFDILSDAGGNYRAFTRVFKGISVGSDGKIHLRFLQGFDSPIVNAIELVPEIGGRMNPVRIVMQTNSYVDHAGRLWVPDRYAIGGLLDTHQKMSVGTADPHLFDGERFGHFAYQIPVAPGRYTVTLHFTEAYFGTEFQRPLAGAGRLFDVYVNGVSLLRNFNILEKAGGPDKPVTESFHGIEPNAAGLIVLSFIPVKNYACVSAIEVTDETE